MLITKLYKDEEWPLKQVIKLVQTNDFHPRFVCPATLTQERLLILPANPNCAAG
jgi:hypothetical protein